VKMAMGTRILIMIFIIDAFLFIDSDINRQFFEKTLNKFGMTINATNDITYSEDSIKTVEEGWTSNLMGAGIGAITGFMIAGVTGMVAGGVLMTIFGDFIFAPVEFMIRTSMPWQLTLIVGGLWSILVVIGMLNFVRGGEY